MIKQKIFIPASPKEVYFALMDEKKHSDFTGAKAKIENKKGGKFSAWDGYATGENLSLEPGKLIVQSWRASDWPDGKISTVTYSLSSKENGCEINFEHKGVPTEFEKDIENGWGEYYWEPLRSYFS